MLSDSELDTEQLGCYAVSLRALRDRSYKGSELELRRLASVQRAQEGRGRYSDAASTAWLRSVLLERQGGVGEACTVVEAIRSRVDRTRLGTSSLGLRASIGGGFAHLAPRLASLRAATGVGPPGVFDAIEWAKGRALADEHELAPVGLDDLHGAVAGTGLHYLTLLLDDMALHAVFVSCRGRPVHWRIDLPRPNAVAMAVMKMRAGHPWSADLPGILDGLPCPSRDGELRVTDTVLVAPHKDLHLLPLHGLMLRDGKPLGPRVSVVRVHGAAQVLRCLKAPARRPRRWVAARVPLASCDGALHRSQFATVERQLRRLPGRVVLEEHRADAASIWAAVTPGCLLHLMCHGGLRRSRVPEDCYLDSGLALAHGGRLPTLADSRSEHHLFTPRALDAQCARAGHGRNSVEGAHVTMQACVSGHARANPQGDAVGLEWAFLLAGAASVLSTHWNVELAAASRFCALFYDAWLGSGEMTRSQAWRSAASQLCEEAPDSNVWQAFTLSGAWQ